MFMFLFFNEHNNFLSLNFLSQNGLSLEREKSR